jgi:hypothetical protein
MRRMLLNVGTLKRTFLALFCSVLFCSVLFCSVLFCSVLFCSVLFCSVLFCSVLFCSLVCSSFKSSATVCLQLGFLYFYFSIHFFITYPNFIIFSDDCEILSYYSHSHKNHPSISRMSDHQQIFRFTTAIFELI